MPAVIYGDKTESVLIQTDLNAFVKVAKIAGKRELITINLDGTDKMCVPFEGLRREDQHIGARFHWPLVDGAERVYLAVVVGVSAATERRDGIGGIRHERSCRLGRGPHLGQYTGNRAGLAMCRCEVKRLRVR